MIVNFFVVSTTSENPVKMDTLYSKFGQGIPRYLQYEGGTGLNYLCCVDAATDVKTICGEYGYGCGPLNMLEVEDSMYTSEYTPHPTYSADGPKFRLRLYESKRRQVEYMMQR